ncbi:hypothetical protein [Streptomyces orinoci]|uniref:Integral membrane protein n=1 Tax=Streptomyces orinoci TaxID=67339 RepID=A0ABV3K1Y0_STRON|nr:hypothetical protein [Streptomyces orinoci]
MRVARVVLGVCGVAFIAVGVWVLGRGAEDPGQVARWVVGPLIVHDAVMAPLTLLVGLVVARLPARRAVRGGLLVAASLTAVACPVLFRPGPLPNPSVLPLSYARNWLLALGLVAATTLVAALAGARARRRDRTGRK